ncbi:MAG: NAD(P)/FAD-dependent oxidoreductase [Oscillospiraceae bacterium]|jgi:protoporphyrinogen oxidase|nr:NAD(P)/FAD-dependent oxidoreductase [Oscillospiraceae bacterium]
MTNQGDERVVVIIGAGPAGLTAAWELLKQPGMHPIILEESEYIGGIARTARYKGNHMDIGGHRFFTKSAWVRDLWQEIMPMQGAPALDDLRLGVEKPLAPGGPDPEREDRVMLVRNRVSRIFYLRHFFDYPISIKLATFVNLGLWRTLRAGVGYLAAAVHKRPEKSLEDFYVNRFGYPLYAMFFEKYTEKLWGVHPSKIAPDWGAQRVKGLSLSKAVFETLRKAFRRGYQSGETSLIEQFAYPKRGPGQLWETLAQEAQNRGAQLYMQASVTQLIPGDGGIRAVVYRDAQGQAHELQADAVLSSMPIKDVVAALGAGVPQNVRCIAEALPYRDFITVGLLLKGLKLRNTTARKTLGNIAPDCWIYIQEPDVRVGRMQLFNNWSPYMVADADHTVWVGLEYFCAEGDELWAMQPQAFIDMAVAEMVKIGIINAADVLDATHIRVKKAYPAYFGAYAQFDTVRAHLDAYDNLYCIGRNGQHRYNNMDHSMLTALEAARLVCAGGGDKAALWGVNTEEDYHEGK